MALAAQLDKIKAHPADRKLRDRMGLCLHVQVVSRFADHRPATCS
jgi:hypothetical protein